MKRLLVPAFALLLLGGCVTDGSAGPNRTMGTLLGAAGGGLAGSFVGSGNGRLAAVAAGTLLGAYAGNQWGAAVDDADRDHARYAPPPRPSRHDRVYRDGQRHGYGQGYADGYDRGYGNGFGDGRY